MYALTILQELGYNEDISYNNLLFPNVQDTRKLLSWLTSQVPIPEKGGAGDGLSQFNLKIEAEIDYLTGTYQSLFSQKLVS